MADTPIDADTLIVKFKAQLESLETLKHDFSNVHQHMEDTFEKFKNKIKDGAQEIKSAHKGMADEIEHGSKKASGAMGELGDALGINVGKFATVAGGALSVMAFVDEMRKSWAAQEQATAMIQGSSGAGTMGQVDQYGGYMERMKQKYYGIGFGTPEEVSKISGQFLGTYGMGQADIFGEKGSVYQAMTMGRSTGLGSENVAGMMSTMVQKLGVDGNNVGEVFAELYSRGKELGNVNGQYLQTVLNITSALRVYGVNLETVANATHMFWRDIEEGRMTVQDLTKAFTVGGTASDGQMAFMSSQVFEKDSELGKYFKGKDVLTQMGIGREILEGGNIGGTQKFNKEKNIWETIGGTQVTPEMQSRAIGDIFRHVSDMASDALKAGHMQETPENRRFFEQNFLKSTSGINYDNLSQNEQDRMMKAFSAKDTKTFGDIAKESRSNELQKLTEIGDLLGGAETSPLKAIEHILENIAVMLGGLILAAPAALVPGPVGDMARQMLKHQFGDYEHPGGQVAQADTVINTKKRMEKQMMDAIEHGDKAGAANILRNKGTAAAQLRQEMKLKLEGKILVDMAGHHPIAEVIETKVRAERNKQSAAGYDTYEGAFEQ